MITIFAASCANLSCLPQASASTSVIANVLAVVFGLVGAIALLMITLSGLKYITSNGDPQRAAQAREGILYALVGVAVAIFAEAIVAFVAGKL